MRKLSGRAEGALSGWFGDSGLRAQAKNGRVGKNRNKTLTDYSFFIIQNKFMIQTKYFLYARKSTEDDDKQIMSIEAQLFELREFARKENLQILEEFTESKSAKKPGREKFGEMMSRIESMDGIGILAWHPLC